MRNLRTRPLGTDAAVSGGAVFGSMRAAQFLQDAQSQTDSVDILTLGDSNAGYAATCGYQSGLLHACSILGMPSYATPLTTTAVQTGGSTQRTSGMLGPLTNIVMTHVNSPTPASGSVTTHFTALATDSDAQLWNNSANAGMIAADAPRPLALPWDMQFVARGITYTSAANGMRIRLLRPHPMTEGTGAGSVPLQYRVVHAKYAGAAGGQFRMLAMRPTNTILASTAYISTSGFGQVDVGYEKLNFDSPSISQASPNREVICSCDGYNNAGYAITGPCGILFHSIIERNRKGYAVTNYHYYGGRTTTQLASQIQNLGNMNDYVLKELRQRQIEATGSGRVVIWMNSGVNGPDDATSWKNGYTTIVDTFRSAWTAQGFPESDLAFILSVTHPQSPGATETALASVREAANEWALENVNNGVTVVDISKLFTYSQLSARRLLSSTNNAESATHLNEMVTPLITTASWPDYYSSGSPLNRYQSGYSYDIAILNNGYTTVATSIVQSLLNSV